jgi:hypothetical protein
MLLSGLVNNPLLLRSALLCCAVQGGKAEAAVAQMMKKCFRDTDPFPRVPGLMN